MTDGPRLSLRWNYAGGPARIAAARRAVGTAPAPWGVGSAGRPAVGRPVLIQLRWNYAGITLVSDLSARGSRRLMAVSAWFQSGWMGWRGAESNRRHYDFQWDSTVIPASPCLSSCTNALGKSRIGLAGLGRASHGFRFFLDSITQVLAEPRA
jgi:hypothetical protein